MNFPWKSSSAEKNLTSDIGKQRGFRDSLASRLENANAMVADRTAAAQKLVLTGADDVSLDVADAEVAKAENRIATLTGALAEADQKLASLERKLAEISDQKRRKQVASEVEAVIVDLGSAGATVIEKLTNLGEVAGRAGLVINDGVGLKLFSERLVAELPAALELIESSLRSHIAAVLSGSAPAVLVKPDVTPAPTLPPQPSKRVFSMAPLFWRESRNEKTCARHQDIEMPVEFANRALTLGYAIEPSDERTRGRRTGFVAPPLPYHCIDLTHANLMPLKPVFGIDRVKQDARFEETVRPDRQNWINPERAQ
jgi:hypothetical protein